MSAVVQRLAQPAKPDAQIPPQVPVRQEALDDVLIHVRFHPNSDVAAVVGERPEHIGPVDWYKLLRIEAFDYYRVFAGGRGFFRIPRAVFDGIVSRLDSGVK